MRIIRPNLSFQLRTEVFHIVIGVVSSVGVPAGLYKQVVDHSGSERKFYCVLNYVRKKKTDGA